MHHHDDPGEKSKSQLKRERAALQCVGEALVKLPDRALARVPLDDALREAVTAARSLRKGAYQRQLRFIARLLREGDSGAVSEALERLQDQARGAARRFHHLEHWRERLVAEGDAAVEALLAEHPHADRPHLRRLLREARAEHETGRPAGAGRALFRYLRELAGD